MRGRRSAKFQASSWKDVDDCYGGEQGDKEGFEVGQIHWKWSLL